jgi:hypothetical protein
MANNLKVSGGAAGVNPACDAVVDLLDSGYLRIYNGTQPSDADDAITTQTLLAELRFGAPAFGSASAGVATANAITADSSANATGTAAWFRALKSDGTSTVFDGSVGVTGCELNIDNTSIATGQQVTVTSMTVTMPESA